jgi:hypothetical protein
MNFVKCINAAYGYAIFINLDNIESIYHSNDGGTILCPGLNGGSLYEVKEKPEEILTMAMGVEGGLLPHLMKNKALGGGE